MPAEMGDYVSKLNQKKLFPGAALSHSEEDGALKLSQQSLSLLPCLGERQGPCGRPGWGPSFLSRFCTGVMELELGKSKVLQGTGWIPFREGVWRQEALQTTVPAFFDLTSHISALARQVVCSFG